MTCVEVSTRELQARSVFVLFFLLCVSIEEVGSGKNNKLSSRSKVNEVGHLWNRAVGNKVFDVTFFCIVECSLNF